jgi:hypothetical protein
MKSFVFAFIFFSITSLFSQTLTTTSTVGVSPVVTQTTAQTSTPTANPNSFQDLNYVWGIKIDGQFIVFQTTNADVIYDPKTQQWNYRFASPNEIPLRTKMFGKTKYGAQNRSNGVNSLTFPDWITHSETDGKAPVIEHGKWLLISEGCYEGACQATWRLVNTETKMSYDFKHYDIVDFQEIDNQIWFTTSTGLISMDEKEPEMIWHRQLPLVPVRKMQTQGDKTFFLTDQSLFFLEGNNLIPIKAIDSGYEIQYLDMLVDGNEVYFLTAPDWFTTSRFASFLNVYHLDTQQTERYAVPDTYADHLLKKGHEIIGYGVFGAIDDGYGQYDFTEGGCFSFSHLDRKIKSICKDPTFQVSSLFPVKLVTMTRQTGTKQIDLHYLTFSAEKNQFVETNITHLPKKNFDEAGQDDVDPYWNEMTKAVVKPEVDETVISRFPAVYKNLDIDDGLATYELCPYVKSPESE